MHIAPGPGADPGLVPGWRRLRMQLPSGASLPQRTWARRHAAVVLLLTLHGVGLAVFGVARGFSPWHAALEGGAIVAFAIAASMEAVPRQWRAILASAGLMSASAVLVHLSGGYIEAHFHFFVMLGVIALYEDWIPFSLAILYVGVHHGLVGTLDPASVYNHPDGIANPWKWALIHATFVLGMSAACITTWRMNEDARLRTQQVLDSAGEGILGLDEEGRIAFANPTATALTGYKPDELARTPLSRILPIDLGGGPSGPRSGEAQLTRKDGSTVAVEWVATPMRASVRGGGAVITVRDVTERLRTQRELEAARHQAAMSEKLSALGTLVSGVAHEIRTPLTYVSNNLHIARHRLQRATDASPPAMRPLLSDVPRALDESLEGIDRINRLVEDLRRFTRVPPETRSPARLDEVVRDAVRLFQATHRGGVTLEEEYVAVPAQTLDPAQLQQVVLNLLENANEAMPLGGRVRVWTRPRPDGTELGVEDDGVGIPPDVQARMFDPFYTTKSHGTGLGLSIVRRIVTAHGGTIECISTPGRGTRFVVRLPAQTPLAPAPATPTTAAA